MRREFCWRVALTALVGMSTGFMEVSAAPQWTPYGTAVATLGWFDCQFKTLQLVYYDDNIPASVDLYRAGQWIKPTSDNCDITNGEMEVVQGDGSVPLSVKTYFIPPVSYPDSWTAWWYQGEMTFNKYGQGVTSYTAAGPYSIDSVKAGWDVIFHANGEITASSLNLENQ